MQLVEAKTLYDPRTDGHLRTPTSTPWNSLQKSGLNLNLSSTGPDWVQGCDSCTRGLVDPPVIDWPTTPDHMNTLEARRAQYHHGELHFCTCLAGRHWRQYFTGVDANYEDPAALLARQQSEYQERKRRQLFDRAGVPPKYLNFTLASFRAIAGKEKGKARALLLVEKYLRDGGVVENDAPKVGIFLHGDPGVGKTGLLSPLFLHYLNEGRSGLWVQYNELMAALRDFESGKAGERMAACQTVDYLFIDDFGDPSSNKSATPWAQDCMFRIVDHRNNHKLPMLITSNLDLAGLGDQFHGRLARRLADSCAIAKMEGRAL